MARFQLLSTVLSELNQILSNAQKTINRPYSPKTIAEKRELVAELCKKIVVLDFSDDTGDHKYLTDCLALRSDIFTVKAKILKLLLSFETCPLSDMAEFNFETALKLPILSADGDETALRDFLDIAESYHNILADKSKPVLVKFLALNKVQGKTKTRLGDVSDITTFDALKSALLSRCGIKDTLESLSQKLFTCQQSRKSLTEYVEELDLLASRLATLQIKNSHTTDGPGKQAIVSTYKTQALLTFKRGVHSELKAVVEASRPATLEDALAVATAAESNGVSANVFAYRAPFRGRGHFRPMYPRGSGPRPPPRYYNNADGHYNQSPHVRSRPFAPRRGARPGARGYKPPSDHAPPVAQVHVCEQVPSTSPRCSCSCSKN